MWKNNCPNLWKSTCRLQSVEKSDVHIGYDEEEGLYVDNNNFRVYIDETEVATVEKLLEGFEIPFTEKVGQAFLR